MIKNNIYAIEILKELNKDNKFDLNSLLKTQKCYSKALRDCVVYGYIQGLSVCTTPEKDVYSFQKMDGFGITEKGLLFLSQQHL